MEILGEMSDGLRVAILTRSKDFHAYAVRSALLKRDARCFIIETDRLAAVGGMSWPLSDETEAATIMDVHGHVVRIRDLDLVWWRRLTGDPQVPETVLDVAARDLVARDCRATMLGIMATEFSRVWVSHPEATRVAENKLIQLRAARQCGLRIPRTLISQNSQLIRDFCTRLNYQVVIKTIAGTPMTPLMTGLIERDMLTSDESLSLSPAIYQEFVPGTRHLRICCFGTDIHTALIETEHLDWRYPLDARTEPYRLDPATAAAILGVIEKLGLRMGIVDMKLDTDGEPVWLEINPQGQFLFLEQMCGIQLLHSFTDFLLREAGANTRPLSRVALSSR
jgi:glutathione synthase/RimK-type ligase-like ATP-grasp enzyme